MSVHTPKTLANAILCDIDNLPNEEELAKTIMDCANQALTEKMEELETYTQHLLECELSDNTLEMSRRKGLGYIPECTCGLTKLLNQKEAGK